MQLDRRDFLRLSGVALAGGVLRPQEPAPVAGFGKNALGLLYDSSKCVGCRACQMACKRWNNLPVESSDAQVLPAEAAVNSKLYDTPLGLTATTWTLIKLSKRSDTDWHFINYQCMHCADAACVTVCPSGALYKDPLGFTGYDASKCIGCGYCTQFCPYGVPHLKTSNLLTGNAKAAKCTFCLDRVYQGLGGPFCATTCPVGALVWGPRQDLLATAKARVATLQSSGFPTAQLYGETQAGGLGRLSILLGDPGRYNLPVNPQTPLVATAWKKVLQPLGEVAIGASIVGAIAAFLISRKHIRMQDVD